MKVWITKFALTAGIFSVEATPKDGMVAYRRSPDSYIEYAHGLAREWHLTPESALDRAEEMRAKKLESLDAQIKKVSKITFEAKP